MARLHDDGPLAGYPATTHYDERGRIVSEGCGHLIFCRHCTTAARVVEVRPVRLGLFRCPSCDRRSTVGDGVHICVGIYSATFGPVPPRPERLGAEPLPRSPGGPDG